MPSISYSSLIPPNLFIVLAAIGVVLAWRRTRRLGLVLASAAMACLYLASMPLAADLLIRSADALAEVITPLPSAAAPAAIIVLSADLQHGDDPAEPDTAGPVTLERLAEGVRLYRRLGLPILVSGGRIEGAGDSLAGVMSRALENEFRVPVRWREDRSLNTYENALFSAAILRRAGVPAAYVVTNPWHMARALWSFRAVGYSVVPAATPDARSLRLSVAAFLPQIPSLLDSYYALHELIGLAWYVCRYGKW